MKLNIQIELDIEEFRYADKRLQGVLEYVADLALERTGETSMTDIKIKALWGDTNMKKIGWWSISQ